MKFNVDENLPIEAATVLRDAGHDALTVHDQNLRGELDPKLREICAAEGRAFVTFDLDFSDFRTSRRTPGCILLRLRRQDRDHVLRTLQQVLPLFERETLTSSIWIVEEGRVRIRKA